MRVNCRFEIMKAHLHMNHALSSSASHVAADADDGLPGLISVVDGLHGHSSRL